MTRILLINYQMLEVLILFCDKIILQYKVK